MISLALGISSLNKFNNNNNNNNINNNNNKNNKFFVDASEVDYSIS